MSEPYFPPPGPYGVLSDQSIRAVVASGELAITPFVAANVQPASYDITLAEDLILARNVFNLAATAEWFDIPPNIVGHVHGRSSIGRLGVLVHFTAGLLDPGWRGNITLELMAFDQPQVFQAGDRIAQVTFHWLDQPAEYPYRGRYQGDVGAIPSKFKHERDE